MQNDSTLKKNKGQKHTPDDSSTALATLEMEKACLDSRQDYVTRAGLYFTGCFTISCSAQLHMTQAMGFPPPLFQGYSRVSLETSL